MIAGDPIDGLAFLRTGVPVWDAVLRLSEEWAGAAGRS
jgi:hypothetical protein